MSQICLELIYNQVIVLDKKILKGDDAYKLSASNKIRILLQVIGVSYEIPIELRHLNNFIAKNKIANDGPEIIVNTRNLLVHSKTGNDVKMKNLTTHGKHEVLNLSLWYVELLILNYLSYEGLYYNRCNRWEESVPWTVPIIPITPKFLENTDQYIG